MSVPNGPVLRPKRNGRLRQVTMPVVQHCVSALWPRRSLVPAMPTANVPLKQWDARILRPRLLFSEGQSLPDRCCCGDVWRCRQRSLPSRSTSKPFIMRFTVPILVLASAFSGVNAHAGETHDTGLWAEKGATFPFIL
jgi:hypothetical protein